MNLVSSDFRSIPRKQQDSNYSPYSNVEVTPYDKVLISKEGFDGHGYHNSDTAIGPNGQNKSQSTIVIENQINPIMSISSDYSKKLQAVNKNYYDISQNIVNITNNDKTGLRDQMSGNDKYDYDTPFNINKQKTLLDGLINDNKQLAVHENAMYVLGTITAATLIVFAIVLGKE